MYPPGSWTLLGLVAFVWALPLQLSAQEFPCAKIQAVPGTAGYQVRSGDSRCEGFYQSPVAGASLELLSLTAGAVEYELRANNILHITAPDVSALNSPKVNVQARSLPLGTYYRMDAIIDSAGSMNWPAAHVIAPAGLTPDTMGVTGWVEKGPNRIFVPLALSDHHRPSSDPASVVAILRSSVDLEGFRWRSWVEGRSEQPAEWRRKPGIDPPVLRAGEPIRLEFGAEKGMTLVEIAARMINSDRWLTIRFRMFRP